MSIQSYFAVQCDDPGDLNCKNLGLVKPSKEEATAVALESGFAFNDYNVVQPWSCPKCRADRGGISAEI